MKQFSGSLRERAKNIIDFEKNNTNKKQELKLHQDEKNMLCL